MDRDIVDLLRLCTVGQRSVSAAWADDSLAAADEIERLRAELATLRAHPDTVARGTARSAADAEKAWEQACRVQWRALALVIKAKLEAVEAGITEFQNEFLAHIVLPNGDTVGSWMRPQVEAAYATGTMPTFLPELGAGE